MSHAKPVVFLSLPRHDGPYTSTPWQLAIEMAKKRTVVFMDHPFTWWEGIRNFRRPDVRKRWLAYFGATSARVDNVHVVWLPFVWPINFLPKGFIYNFFSSWNHRLVAGRLNRFFLEQGIVSYFFVNSFDFYFPRLTRFLRPRPALRVYHCIDPMVKKFTLKHGVALQLRAAAGSDLVISTAPSLQRQFNGSGLPESYLVPNGANAELFNKAMDPATLVYPAVQHVKGRVMGFVGNIERRTDFALIEQVLALLPHWTLVMAGPCDSQWVPQTLVDHPQIIWLGAVPHADAPAVVKRFDVALIPFVCDNVSAGIFPLKLFEYLAAGKPVVTTRFNPEVLSTLDSVIQIADDAPSFASLVQKAYATDDMPSIKKRIEIAFKNTWQERAAQFEEIMHSHWYEQNVTKRIH